MSMRIPKYRAWDKTNKRMYHVAVLFAEAHTVMLQSDDMLFSRSFDEIELMQSLGLLDRNACEVYEGDVIEAILNDGGEHKPVREAVTWNEEYVSYNPFNNLCCWDEDRWINNFWDEQRSTADEHCFSVIGNIYENPELLEKRP